MPKKNNEPPRIPVCHPDRKHAGNGLCKQCYDREYSRANRQRLNAKAYKWAKTHPERIKVVKRRYLYGIEPEEVQAISNAQDGLCKICRKAPGTNLDHNHETGQVRGLLCGDCNRALGLFRDDIQRLEGAIFYLKLWDDRCVQVVPNTGARADGKQ